MPSQLTWLTLLFGAFFVFATSNPTSAGPPVHSLEAIAAALDSTSPVLAQASAEVEFARAALSNSRAFPNPTIFGSQESLDDAESSMERTIGVRQSLGFLWSQHSRHAAAKAKFDAAQAGYLESRHAVLRNLVELAFEYDRLKQQSILMDSVLARAEHLSASIRERRRVGDIAPYDEQRFLLEIVQLQSRKQDVQKGAAAALLELVKLTGRSAEEIAELSLQLPPAAKFESEAEAARYALESRPELRSSAFTAAAGRHALDQARWNQLPDFSLGIGHKSLDPGPSGLYIEGELEIPLWSQRRSEKNIARAELRLAELQRERLVTSIQDEVNQAYRQLRAAEQLQPLVNETLSDSASVNMARGVQLYLEGEMSAFELVDALRTNLEAQDAVLSLRNSLAVARAEFRRAVGLDPLEEQQP